MRLSPFPRGNGLGVRLPEHPHSPATGITMPEPWRFEKIKLKSGLTLRVARAGSGPPIIMLHGFPECWYSWRHQIRALSDRRECIAPELRGYGKSDAPVGVANYTLDKLVG